MAARSRALCAPLALALCLLSASPVRAQVELKNVDGDRVEITINGKPFSNFYYGAAYAKPFVAPLRSADGLVVTRKWPMENVEGESRDHPHHKGMFIGFGDISDVNFWEVEAESKPSGENPKLKGSVVLKSLGDLKPGKKQGSVSASFNWQAAERGVMLVEDRTMTFYADSAVRMVDVDFTLTAKTNVKFGDTKEGFFAIRLADSMTGKKGGIMTSSEGAQTEKNVWGKRADWVDYDGTVDGQKVGIVIFDCPANFNHPPRWHSRDYGLFAVNPFGLKEFDPKATEAGGKELKAGDSLRFRYRVVIHPGDVPKKNIADMYEEYAKKFK